MKDNFSMDRGGGGWISDDSSTLHLLCTLFVLLHHSQLRSSDIRSWRLGTLELERDTDMVGCKDSISEAVNQFLTEK